MRAPVVADQAGEDAPVRQGLVAGMLDHRRLYWRSALAGPFVLSLILALLLGPATIDSRHGSFIWLAVVSLIAALLILGVRPGLLIPVGVATFLIFPALAGLGFYFAPAWARPIVAVVFYGSMLASLAAVITGTVSVLRGWRRRTRLIGVAAGLLVLVVIGLVAVRGFDSALSDVTATSGTETAVVNLGPAINTAHRESEASFTADGRTMYFNCDDYDICVSHLIGTWEQAQWTTPEIVGPPISTAHIEVEPWISPAGDRLYFTSTRPFGRDDGLPGLSTYVDVLGRITLITTDRLGHSVLGGLGEDDIWVSDLVGGVWSEPRNLSDVNGAPPVNTSFFDHCLSVSADGNEAFWTSTRPGGFGGNDIWTSRRVDGRWTPAQNLGPMVNGPGSDHHSIPTPDGNALYITSDRPGGFGADDMYTTARDANGQWGRLANAGQPMNGPGNDRCASWTPDGEIFLFDSDRAGGFGSKDLWWTRSRT
jgi:WD40-like Beta Propeller Repeat